MDMNAYMRARNATQSVIANVIFALRQRMEKTEACGRLAPASAREIKKGRTTHTRVVRKSFPRFTLRGKDYKQHLCLHIDDAVSRI